MPNRSEIEALESLRNFLISYRAHQVPTMNHYASADGCGFWHQQSRRGSASLSSTATCVSSLVHANLWNSEDRKWGSSSPVAKRLIRKPWTSAELEKNNPFSLSFIAEGVLNLIEAEPYPDANKHGKLVTQIAELLLEQVKTGEGKFAMPGSVSIDPYPPSAYLTQLAFRVLVRTSADNPELFAVARTVKTWAVTEVYRQLALISTNNRLGDPLQLAYATILLASASVDEQTSPEEKGLIRQALKRFFDSQLADGTWPPSQPLFHYPTVGNAHAFDYELLTELLRCEPLQEELLTYVPQLKVAAEHLEHSAFELGNGAYGWASGHHPQIEGPESWSTASVYDFLHSFDRLAAEASRRALFTEVRAPYEPPERSPRLGASDFAAGFLDAKVVIDGTAHSLRDTLRDYFVLPIARERSLVANGQRLGDTTPMSAILFGPPGTSKTQLAKLIGKYLGWPVLAIDPSYLVHDGIDHLYARANQLFSMLTMAEQVVVLLDEFDELGKDRAQATDVLSRFITTSMLPKLAAINEQRKIVFLLATNYVSNFDAAFSRRGRFDMMLQVMPPTANAKCEFKPWKDTLQAALHGIDDQTKQDEAKAGLDDLTYLETQQLISTLSKGVADVYGEFVSAAKRGTLNQPNGEQTWKQTCETEQKFNRLPPVSVADASSVTIVTT